MDRLPSRVYSVSSVRAADRWAIERLGLSGRVLMARAAAAAFETLRCHWPRVGRILVLCGPGNNGGDGYVLAALAAAEGYPVVVVAPAGLPSEGDAQAAHADWQRAGGVLTNWRESLLTETDLVIDALLGTGLSRPVSGVLAAVIEAVNAAGRPVLSLDVPSGLSADDGRILGQAIKADVTITFVGLKTGCFLGEGPNQTGRLLAHGLGLPPAVFSEATPVWERLTPEVLQAALPRRSRTAHKGSAGRVLIIGGGAGLLGAVRLAGEAALAVGAGLVQIGTAQCHAAALAAACPELMVAAIEGPHELMALVAQADVVAIGPGLGRGSWAHALWEAVKDCDRPLIVDADALNLLSMAPVKRARWCLTPHPGEAARLLGLSTLAVQADRRGALLALEQRFGATVVLKGAGSLVSHDPLTWLCDRGNAGMAVGGMGDALTGVIAGIAAQQPAGTDPLRQASGAGVYLHALAGDRAAVRGERGMRPSDLIRELPACL